MSDKASGPALPDEECRVPPRKSWSDLEKWVWHEVGSGRVADINAYLGKTADPGKPDDWGTERRLSPAFLESILLHDPWQGAIPRAAVRIFGALFAERIDLRWTELQIALWIDRSRFLAQVLLSNVRVGRDLSFRGSTFQDQLFLDSAKIDGSLFLRDGSEFATLIARGATVAGQVTLNRAKIYSLLDMQAMRIGEALFMDDGQFGDVAVSESHIGSDMYTRKAVIDGPFDAEDIDVGGSLLMLASRLKTVTFDRARVGGNAEFSNTIVCGKLGLNTAHIRGSLHMDRLADLPCAPEFSEICLRGARIGGQLCLDGARVAKKLDLHGVTIEHDFFLRDGAKVVDVDLEGARIGEEAAFVRRKIAGELKMQSAQVGHLILREGVFFNEIDLRYVRVDGNFDLSGAALTGLDFTGSRVGGELRLAWRASQPKWGDGAKLCLDQASARVVQDEPEAWPKEIKLHGFTYDSFSGLGSSAGIAGRGSRWFVEWLGKHRPYTPQPYQHCAKVLRELGHPEMADDVLYAGREREREEARRSGNNPRATGLALLKWTIGYGYGHRYFRSLWWVAGFVAFGTLVLWVSGQIGKVGGDLTAGAFYSFDLLLPVIQLYEPHYQAVLKGVAKYYFAFHKLMGYVLASFLIAGLAGLTK